MHNIPRLLVILVLIFGGIFVYKTYFKSEDKPDVLIKVESYIPKILSKKQYEVKPIEQSSKINIAKDFDILKELAKAKSGRYSIYIYDLSSNNIFVHNETFPFYAASLYKFPFAIGIMQQVQNGKLSLDKKIEYKERHLTGGTGSIQKEKFGNTFSVEELLIKLLKESDNVAQNMLSDVFDMSNFSQTFKTQFANKKFPYDMFVNSREYVDLLKNFVDEKYLNSENTAYVINIMSETGFDNYIYAGLKEPLKLAHKIGSWPTNNAWHDCGIVYFADKYKDSKKTLVCVMSEKTTTSEFVEVSKLSGEFINRAFFE